MKKPPLTEQEIREAFATRWGCLGSVSNEDWTRRALAGDAEALAELRDCHRQLRRHCRYSRGRDPRRSAGTAERRRRRS